MKYIAIIDEDMLNDFELIHDGKTLVLEDKNGTTRPVKIKPITKEMVVCKDGKSGYLTQGHIDAMIEYEQRKQIESIQKDFEGWSKRLAMIANKSTIPASKFAESIRILEQCGSSPKEKEQ